MKIYPSNLNHIRFTKPTNEEIQEKYNFPCSITVLNQSLSTSEVFYYDGEGNEFPQGRFNIPSDYLFQKALLKTDTAPTIKGLYPLSETGIYTNIGGINAPIGKLNFASFDGTKWSLVSVDLSLEPSNYFTKSDINTKIDIYLNKYIPKWNAQLKKYEYSSISDDGITVTVENDIKILQQLFLLNIPTSPNSLPSGSVWRDGNTLKIV